MKQKQSITVFIPKKPHGIRVNKRSIRHPQHAIIRRAYREYKNARPNNKQVVSEVVDSVPEKDS